jgi:hypothetical protein
VLIVASSRNFGKRNTFRAGEFASEDEWVGRLAPEPLIAILLLRVVNLLRELRTIAEQWQERLTARGTRKHATVWRVANLLLGQPVVTVSSLVDRLEVTFPSANAAVAVLVDMGVLRPRGQQRRNRAFHAHEVMNLLYTGIDAVLDDVATLRNYRAKSRT